MPTNRELLELAAKAAGIGLAWSSIEDQSPRNQANWNSWNPMEDDGDAFRLAVKLGIQIDPYGHEMRASIIGDGWEEDPGNFGGDECAAMRLAIVLVAARIGEDSDRR